MGFAGRGTAKGPRQRENVKKGCPSLSNDHTRKAGSCCNLLLQGHDANREMLC